MNAVRLPVSATDYNASPAYRSRADRLVRLANHLALLVILESSGPPNGAGAGDPELFWRKLAARFTENPNVFFAPMSTRLGAAVRQSGAKQPVILAGSQGRPPDYGGVIYEVAPGYASMQTDRDRGQQLHAAARVPVLVNGLDPRFDEQSEQCAAIPGDPAQATSMVEENLAYFDARQISWTLSSFTARKLITDYRYFNGTKLDAGWTRGKPAETPAGIGMLLLSHLWSATPLGLLTVSESRGGLVIACGGISTAYGPILADQEMSAHGSLLPMRLGNVSKLKPSPDGAGPAPRYAVSERNYEVTMLKATMDDLVRAIETAWSTVRY